MSIETMEISKKRFFQLKTIADKFRRSRDSVPPVEIEKAQHHPWKELAIDLGVIRSKHRILWRWFLGFEIIVHIIALTMAIFDWQHVKHIVEHIPLIKQFFGIE